MTLVFLQIVSRLDSLQRFKYLLWLLIFSNGSLLEKRSSNIKRLKLKKVSYYSLIREFFCNRKTQVIVVSLERVIFKLFKRSPKIDNPEMVSYIWIPPYRNTDKDSRASSLAIGWPPDTTAGSSEVIQRRKEASTVNISEQINGVVKGPLTLSMTSRKGHRTCLRGVLPKGWGRWGICWWTHWSRAVARNSCSLAVLIGPPWSWEASRQGEQALAAEAFSRVGEYWGRWWMVFGMEGSYLHCVVWDPRSSSIFALWVGLNHQVLLRVLFEPISSTFQAAKNKRCFPRRKLITHLFATASLHGRPGSILGVFVCCHQGLFVCLFSWIYWCLQSCK